MKKIVKTLPLLIIMLCACAKDASIAIFVITPIDGTVSIHTEAQTNYLHDEYKNIGKYAGNQGEMSIPKPVHLTWGVDYDGKVKEPSYSLYLWENENEKWEYNTNETEIDIYNCKAGATYHYQVATKLSANTFTSEVASFTTESLFPRNIFIEGVTNVRDLGGRGNIKQGLLYRSGELNDGDSSNLSLKITDKGIQEMSDHLKIKSEIDLRKDSELGGYTKCAFNEQANYIHLPMGYNGPTMVMKYSSEGLNNLARIKDFFEILANKDNLPAVFHCTFGRDRTGYLAYLVEGLCGASQEEVFQDYLFTNFADLTPTTFSNINGTGAYPAVINKEEGDTLQERVYNYLTSDASNHPGISKDTLDQVIENLCN